MLSWLPEGMDGDRNEAWWKRLGQAATWKETVTGRLVLSWRNWLDHRFSLTDDLVLPDVKGRRTFFFVPCGEAEFTQGKTTILLCIPKCRRYLRCLEDVVYSRGTDFIFVVFQNTTRCVQNERYVSSPRASGVTCRIVRYIMHREKNRDTRVLWNYFFKIIIHNSGSLRMSYI